LNSSRLFRTSRPEQFLPQQFAAIAERALRDTIRRFEETGSPVITDGEQTKPSFATYPIDGLPNLASDGAIIPFADGHARQLPRLTAGPFHYATYASTSLGAARRLTAVPVKQAVISASALSLLYPASAIPGYSSDTFLSELVGEAVAEIQHCLAQGADSVQIDFTGGRLSLKLDPSGGLLENFVALNNRFWIVYQPPNGSVPASMSVLAGTGTQPIAPTWTTRGFCPLCFSCGCNAFTSGWRANPTRSAFSGSSASICRPIER
jgi:methionine synthase II (cobalamin-independent)